MRGVARGGIERGPRGGEAREARRHVAASELEREPRVEHGLPRATRRKAKLGDARGERSGGGREHAILVEDRGGRALGTPQPRQLAREFGIEHLAARRDER